jgi:predicted phage tail protein
MQRVRLLGELGELFGAEFTYYNLRRPADAIKMLCINRPAFKDYLLNSEENGVAFQVIQANAAMVFDDLLLPFGSNDLVIAPVISGSGGPVGKIITGVALVVAAVVTGGIASAGVALGGLLGIGTVGTAVVAVGASLALSGVAQLVSPQPQIPLSIGSIGGVGGGGAFGGGSFAGGGARFGSRNRTNGPEGVTRGLDGQQSYAYTGAANTVGVGATVPLAYGKVLIGSHLLRSKVQVTDESDPLLSFIKKPGTDTMLVGGEKFTTEFDDVSGAVIKKVEPYKDTFKSPNDNEAKLGANGEIKLNPAAGGSSSVSERVQKDNTYKTNFNVVFEFTSGLSAPVAGIGTTTVDAFVTYEIKVFRGDNEDSENLIAVDTVTVQGLLDSSTSNKFVYMHQMELPQMTTNTWIRVVTNVIDSDAGIGSVLKMAYIGYALS